MCIAFFPLSALLAHHLVAVYSTALSRFFSFNLCFAAVSAWGRLGWAADSGTERSCTIDRTFVLKGCRSKRVRDKFGRLRTRSADRGRCSHLHRHRQKKNRGGISSPPWKLSLIWLLWCILVTLLILLTLLGKTQIG